MTRGLITVEESHAFGEGTIGIVINGLHSRGSLPNEMSHCHRIFASRKRYVGPLGLLQGLSYDDLSVLYPALVAGQLGMKPTLRLEYIIHQAAPRASGCSCDNRPAAAHRMSRDAARRDAHRGLGRHG